MKQWGAFALLCLVQGFSWIALEHTSAGITAASCAAGAFLAAFVLLAFQKSALVNVLGSVCLVVGPWMALALGDSMPGSSAVVLALTLVPVVIAVAAPALTDREFSPAQLWPGLAAATALMILAPLPSFADWHSDVVLIAIPIVVGIGCVLATSLSGLQKTRVAAMGVSAVVFAAMTLVISLLHKQRPSVSLIAVGVCAVTFTLVSLAVQNLSAKQYAAQFAIVPLLALLQGPFVLSWEIVSWRFLFSAVLLLAASVTLLGHAPDDSEEKLA